MCKKKGEAEEYCKMVGGWVEKGKEFIDATRYYVNMGVVFFLPPYARQR